MFQLSVQVWPKGKTVFPDFLLPQTADVWKELIINHFKAIQFDGLWIVSMRDFLTHSAN